MSPKHSVLKKSRLEHCDFGFSLHRGIAVKSLGFKTSRDCEEHPKRKGKFDNFFGVEKASGSIVINYPIARRNNHT